MLFSELVVGQVVSFIYNKGTNPGQKRLVEVTKLDKGCVEGNDLNAPEDNKHRKYLSSEIDGGSLRLVATEDEQVVLFGKLFNTSVSHLNLHQIIDIAKVLFPSQEKGSIRYCNIYNVLTMPRPKKVSLEIAIDKNNTQLNFVLSDGSKLGLSFENSPADKTAYIPIKRNCFLSEETLRDFAKELNDSFGDKQNANRLKRVNVTV